MEISIMAKKKYSALKEGSRYRTQGKIGNFTVVKRFKDDDGEHKVQIIEENTGDVLERFEEILAPASKEIDNINYFNDNDLNNKYIFTLGYLTRHATFVIDIPNKSQKSFDQKYIMIKGKEPMKDGSKYKIHKCDDTWTYSIRVFFPIEGMDEDLFILPPSVYENSKNDGANTKRVSDNEWAWKLIGMGFDIGNFHDVDMIKDSIPENRLKHFEAGLAT